MFRKYFNLNWKSPAHNPIDKKMNQEATPITHSPVPQPKIEEAVILMPFGEAMFQLSLGKKIHKLDWNDKNEYAFLNENEQVCLHHANGVINTWLLRKVDIEGRDYIIL